MHTPKTKWYYYVLAIPIYLMVLLPFPLFYALSDALSFTAYHLLQYRKKVVLTNLHNAFPNKSENEITAIAKAYYRNMVDVFLETFKTLVLSKRAITKRVTVHNTEPIIELHNQGKYVILLLGHFGNWEWGGFSYTYQLNYEVGTLYHPLSNPFFDWITFKLRSKCGVELIAMQQSARNFLQKKHVVRTVAFIADQSPTPETAYWTTFLNQDTGFFVGGEKLASKYNMAVFYADVVKPKRGHYQVHFKLITENPAADNTHQTTEQFVQFLEQSITQNPALWLWSHRRWKHKRP